MLNFSLWSFHIQFASGNDHHLFAVDFNDGCVNAAQ